MNSRVRDGRPWSDLRHRRRICARSSTGCGSVRAQTRQHRCWGSLGAPWSLRQLCGRTRCGRLRTVDRSSSIPCSRLCVCEKCVSSAARGWALQVATRLASAPLCASAGTSCQTGRVCPRALRLAVRVASRAVINDLAALGVPAVPLLEEAPSGLADGIDHRRTLRFWGRPRPQVCEVAFGLRVLRVLAAAERLVLTQRLAQLLIVARAR